MFRAAFVALLTLLSLLPSAWAEDHEALRFGKPDTGHIIDYGTFVMSYDGRLRSARWVAARLMKDSLKGDTDRQNNFRPDMRIPSEFRAELADYKGSGLDRGHLEPSADHRIDEDINGRTFFLTNMSPQVGVGFNRDYWARLERTIRAHALDASVKELYVFTGPLFMPKNAHLATETDDEDAADEEADMSITYKLIGGNHIPVPTHYFKAILVVPTDTDRSAKLYTFVLPNDRIEGTTDLKTFAKSTDFVEHWAGFDLWSELPDDIEAQKENTAWRPWAALSN